MELAAAITLLCAGGFFLGGLLLGVWKYVCIVRSPEAVAPVYVDIAHRAALLYGFASLVVLEFVERSPFPAVWTLVCAVAPQVFFGLAIFSYVVHGVLRDTDNQLRAPYRLGSGTLPGWVIHGFMVALIVAEVGGFGALFCGVAWSLVTGGITGGGV